MMYTANWFRGAASGWLALLAVSTHATPTAAVWGGLVDGYTLNGSVSVNPIGPGTTEVSPPVGVVGDTVTTRTVTGAGPVPYLSSFAATASPPINGGFSYGNAQALLEYSFVVTGPTEFVQMRVKANGSGRTSPLAPGGQFLNQTAFAEFTVGLAAGPPAGNLDIYRLTRMDLNDPGINAGEISGTIETGFSGAFEVDGLFLAATGREYRVQMQTYAWSMISGYLGGGAIDTSAYLDSSFALEPSDPGLAGLYQLEFSPGIAGPGQTAVPEGGLTVGLLGSALGVCAALRRLSRDHAVES